MGQSCNAAFCCGISELLFVDKAPRPSEEENRMLSGFPALSAQSLLSGDFMDGIESYLSDAFFCRSGAAAFSDSLTGTVNCLLPTVTLYAKACNVARRKICIANITRFIVVTVFIINYCMADTYCLHS